MGERGRNRLRGGGRKGRREEGEEREVGWINDSASKETAVTLKKRNSGGGEEGKEGRGGGAQEERKNQPNAYCLLLISLS